MLFLLKYLNLKFSNKFRFVPVRPNIIDTSIYYSITISTPWFIQTLYSQGSPTRPARYWRDSHVIGSFMYSIALSWRHFRDSALFYFIRRNSLYHQLQLHPSWFEHFDICKQFLAVRREQEDDWVLSLDLLVWESFGFYKTLIRMYPWDIMVIGPGNSSLTHTLEYFLRLRMSVQLSQSSALPSYELWGATKERRQKSLQWQ